MFFGGAFETTGAVFNLLTRLTDVLFVFETFRVLGWHSLDTPPHSHKSLIVIGLSNVFVLT